VRDSDLVARLGGDEFVVLIEDHGGPEEVMIVAQKILMLLDRPVLVDWREVHVSCSIGISSSPDDGEEVDALVKNADIAMYQAKGIAPQHLRLEVTESMMMSDPPAAERALRALQGLGVELAVDDFGTGFSSLSLVRRFPIHVVKIDRSFVAGCPHNRECVAIA